MRSAKVKEVVKTWLSLKEVMSYLGVSKQYIKKLRDNDEIQVSRYGNLYWYNKESVDSFLEKNII